MRLLIGNSTSTDLVGDFERAGARWWAQRLAWFARDGDVLVLPGQPDEAFVDYVTSLTGTRRSTLRFVVPPPGTQGADRLTPDRLLDDAFRADVVAAIDGRPVDEVFALWPDRAVVSIARLLGAEDAVPGAGFVSQGGGTLANSKAVYRAVAAGAGVPIPAGTVCANRVAAEEAVLEFVTAGHPVMVKHEFYSGGVGNHVVSPVEGMSPVGAPKLTVAADRPAVRAFLEESWDYLTGGGAHKLVVERYHPGSTAAFAEFVIGDDGAALAGEGQLLRAPIAAAQIIPGPQLAPEHRDQLIDGGRRLCGPLHAMGYRGRLSADAIVTADGQVLFTEYNGRVTGSTHVYAIIGDVVVGPGFAADRLIVERIDWKVPSFGAAIEALITNGLAYDPASRSGVILSSAFDADHGTVWYCVVAPDYDTAREYEEKLATLWSGS